MSSKKNNNSFDWLSVLNKAAGKVLRLEFERFQQIKPGLLDSCRQNQRFLQHKEGFALWTTADEAKIKPILLKKKNTFLNTC